MNITIEPGWYPQTRMTMKLKIELILILCLLSTVLSAQDISTSNLNWKVDSLVDLSTNEGFEYACTFETSGQGNISWNQKGGFTSTLNVNSQEGTWTNVQANGSVVYSVTYEEETGTIRFERTDSGWRIKLLLGPPNLPSLKHEYIVSVVTEIP